MSSCVCDKYLKIAMKRKVISRVSSFFLTFTTKIKFQYISRIPIVSKHHLRSNHENLVDCRIEEGGEPYLVLD